MWKYKPNKPFPLHLTFWLWCLVKAIETLTHLLYSSTPQLAPLFLIPHTMPSMFTCPGILFFTPCMPLNALRLISAYSHITEKQLLCLPRIPLVLRPAVVGRGESILRRWDVKMDMPTHLLPFVLPYMLSYCSEIVHFSLW